MSMDIASPPDREKLVAELFFGSEQWAEINQESNHLILELYPRRDGRPWEFSYDEAIAALEHARRRLVGDES
jgi:hypothetical protein